MPRLMSGPVKWRLEMAQGNQSAQGSWATQRDFGNDIRGTLATQLEAYAKQLRNEAPVAAFTVHGASISAEIKLMERQDPITVGVVITNDRIEQQSRKQAFETARRTMNEALQGPARGP